MTYRFIGLVSEVGGVKLERLGQSIDLAPDEARNAFAGGAALRPESDFHFSEQECDLYATAGQREFAPPEFKEKYAAALAAFGVDRATAIKGGLV
jgi:hypothetical protein